MEFVVRLYDGFDNVWCDVSQPVTIEEAKEIWNEKTGKGTHNTCFGDIDYYRIFPADTKMLYSSDTQPDQRMKGIQIEVIKGGISGNNPAEIKDDQGYTSLLWSHWTSALGLEKGMKGTIYFAEDIN